MFGIGSRVLVAAVCATASLVAVSLASAESGPVKLKGTQTVVNEAKGLYAMKGSLIGSWKISAFKVNYSGPDGEFVGSGKELFKGCLDADGDGTCAAGDPRGTLRFSFIYWATFDPKTDALVRGDCVHPVTGGTGGFAKAKGVIHMIDTPAGSGVKTTYTGSLLLSGVAPAAVGSGGETRQPAGRSSGRTCGG
jgi:hypothetical protein